MDHPQSPPPPRTHQSEPPLRASRHANGKARRDDMSQGGYSGTTLADGKTPPRGTQYLQLTDTHRSNLVHLPERTGEKHRSSDEMSQSAYSNTTSTDGKMSLDEIEAWLAQHHERLHILQNDLARLQDQVRLSSTDFLKAQRARNQSLRELEDGRLETALDWSRTHAGPNLSLLSQRSKDDGDVLDAAVRNFAVWEKAVQSKRTQMQEVEEAFMHALKQLFAQMRLLPVLREDDFVLTIKTDAKIPEPKTNAGPVTLLDQYYDEAANVREYGESLVDTDYRFQEEVGARALQREQDMEPQMSDEAFYDEYQHSRRIISDKLDCAIERADELKRECERHDITIDEALSEMEGVPTPEAMPVYQLADHVAASEISPPDYSHGSDPDEMNLQGSEMDDWLVHVLPATGLEFELPYYDDEEKGAAFERLSWLDVAVNTIASQPSKYATAQIPL